MNDAVVSKIKNMELGSLITFIQEYEHDTSQGHYNFNGDFFPYHLSDAIFLYDNAYYYTRPREDSKETRRRKLYKIINSEVFFFSSSIAYILGMGAFFPIFAATQLENYLQSFIPDSMHWAKTMTSILGFATALVLPVLAFILLFFIVKDINFSCLTILDRKKTTRLKNVSMVNVDKDMPENIAVIHFQFCNTMEDMFKNTTPQALSNAGWDLLISAYESYTSLYVFLVEKNGVISNELMDKYATKLEKRYQEFHSLAQEVIDNSLRYQLYLFNQERQAASLEQDMLDGDALRAIPLEEEKEL